MQSTRLRRHEVKSASLTPTPRHFKISDLESRKVKRWNISELHHEEM